MDMLAPGYPKTNPILEGIAAICAGQPVEQALEDRDRQLTTAFDFAHAALEAACWLPAQSPLLDGLLAQATQAFDRCFLPDRGRLLAQAHALSTQDHPWAHHLYERWSAMVPSR